MRRWGPMKSWPKHLDPGWGLMGTRGGNQQQTSGAQWSSGTAPRRETREPTAGLGGGGGGSLGSEAVIQSPSLVARLNPIQPSKPPFHRLPAQTLATSIVVSPTASLPSPPQCSGPNLLFQTPGQRLLPSLIHALLIEVGKGEFASYFFNYCFLCCSR